MKSITVLIIAISLIGFGCKKDEETKLIPFKDIRKDPPHEKPRVDIFKR